MNPKSKRSESPAAKAAVTILAVTAFNLAVIGSIAALGLLAADVVASLDSEMMVLLAR